ncbi:MAG: diaminopimelate dehydrogenase [Bacillota bacterium]
MTCSYDKIRVAVVGLGNVGRGALDAIEVAPDMEIAGIVEREEAIASIQAAFPQTQVVSSIEQLTQVDVAVLAVPTRSVPEMAKRILASGISTVDSFDIHGSDLWQLRCDLDPIAKQAGVASISSAGWDPGTDSLIRAIFAIQAPRGISYTNFGPGMSMGHTVAVKKIAGVRDALAMTLPKGLGQHKRMVYVELLDGYCLEDVAQAIKQDAYFCHDETHVQAVDDVRELADTGHGVLLERKGIAGRTANQIFRYEIRVTNPAVTGQVLVSTARAAKRMSAGAYTMLEVPLVKYLPGNLEEIVKRHV